MVIDSLFICFCEDFKENDGSPGKEYYAPRSLLKFINESTESGGDIALAPVNKRIESAH